MHHAPTSPRTRRTPRLLVALACLASATVAAQPAAPPAAGTWEADVAAYAARDRERPPETGGVCFIGSSNIRLWTTLADDFPGMTVVNRGVGGCRLAELAEFAPRLVAAAKPRVIVVSAGTNDINAGAAPAEVRAAFAALVGALKREVPDAVVAFLAISPSLARWEQRDRQREANEAVRDFIAASGDRRLRYLDANAAFLGPDGRPDPSCFVKDRQHPSVAGNARRAAILRPLLADLLRESAPAAAR